MPRDEYQQELERLRADVYSMANRVLDRYADALEAYETGDETVAESVIEGDHEINERYLELEGDCIELLALQQPVAGDLRFVAATFKILTDLERIGDLATNLAGYGTEETSPLLAPEEVVALGERAGEMVADAIDAYDSANAEATWEIAARDDDLDRACQDASRRVVRQLLEDDPSSLSDAEIEARLADVSRTLLTIRDIERVGDHAVNVCARTLYMVENDDGLIY